MLHRVSWLGGLHIVGQNDERIASFVGRSPVDEGAALDQCGESFWIPRFEFRSVINVERDEALINAVVAHAVIPRVHIAAVVIGKSEGLSKEVVEPLPVYKALPVYAVCDHGAAAAQRSRSGRPGR